MKKHLSKEEFIVECKKFLDYFGKDYSGKEIRVNSGDLSVICNPNSKFYELFGGHSIYSVIRFIAEEENKKIVWTD